MSFDLSTLDRDALVAEVLRLRALLPTKGEWAALSECIKDAPNEDSGYAAGAWYGRAKSE